MAEPLIPGDEAGRAAAWRARSVTRTHRGRAGVTLALAGLTFLAVAVSAQHIGSYAVAQGISPLAATLPGLVAALAAAFVLVMAGRAFLKSLAAGRSADVEHAFTRASLQQGGGELGREILYRDRAAGKLGQAGDGAGRVQHQCLWR